MNKLKDELASLLRHALTALAGIGTLLAARGCIADEDAAAVNAAGLSMGEALIVVVIAIVARVLISVMGKLRLPGNGSSPAWMMTTGGLLTLLMAAGSLISCADPSAPRFIFGFETDQARATYDSDEGGSVRVEARVPTVRVSK